MYQLLKVVFLQSTAIVGGKPKLKSQHYTGIVSAEDAAKIAEVHGWDCLVKLPEPEAATAPEPEKKADKKEKKAEAPTTPQAITPEA